MEWAGIDFAGVCSMTKKKRELLKWFLIALVVSVKLVEDNLVGTIIFLSLLIWIPVSTAVHCFVSRTVVHCVLLLWIPSLSLFSVCLSHSLFYLSVSVFFIQDVWWSQKQKKEREPKYKSDDELTPLLQYVEESGSFPMPMKPDIRFNPDADLEKDKITKHLPS